MGKFKGKVYADLKKNGITATKDSDRANLFVQQMEETCKTPEGPEYDREHKTLVENNIKSNEYIFQNVSLKANLPENPNGDNEKIVKKITSKEVKEAIKNTLSDCC